MRCTSTALIVFMLFTGTILSADDKVAVISMKTSDPQVNVFITSYNIVKAPVTIELLRGMRTHDQVTALGPVGIRLSDALMKIDGVILTWWPTVDRFHIRLARAFDWDETRPVVVATIKQSCTGGNISIDLHKKEEVTIWVEGTGVERSRAFYFDHRIAQVYELVLKSSDPRRRSDLLDHDEHQLVESLFNIAGVESLVLGPYSLKLSLGQIANARGVEEDIFDLVQEYCEKDIVIRHLK